MRAAESGAFGRLSARAGNQRRRSGLDAADRRTAFEVAVLRLTANSVRTQPSRLRNQPLAQGFLYLVAIIDWATRAVLAWRLSNTMDTGFCIEALDEALARHGQPKIFNTDQGAQFTSAAFTGRLEAAASDFDGRTRSFHGQHLYRTVVALDQV
jgi:transposase InsO family protein